MQTKKDQKPNPNLFWEFSQVYRGFTAGRSTINPTVSQGKVIRQISTCHESFPKYTEEFPKQNTPHSHSNHIQTIMHRNSFVYKCHQERSKAKSELVLRVFPSIQRIYHRRKINPTVPEGKVIEEIKPCHVSFPQVYRRVPKRNKKQKTHTTFTQQPHTDHHAQIY